MTRAVQVQPDFSTAENIIHKSAVVKEGVVLSPPVRLHKDVIVGKDVRIGKYTYVSAGSVVGPKTEIGAYCSVAKYVEIAPAEHPTDFLSTHSFQYSPSQFSSLPAYDIPRRGLPSAALKTVIGDDVWIGAKALIKRGVTIGTGAVIGAGAIVTKDVPPYAVIAGVPGKLLRYRFDKKTIKRLLASRWWELEPQNLTGVSFEDIDAALDEIERRGKTAG